MSLSEHPDPMPLGLAVLLEALGCLEPEFGMLDRSLEAGARQARLKELLGALDRYLQLEADVFFPALESAGLALCADCTPDCTPDCTRYHAGLKVAMAALDDSDGRQSHPRRIHELRCAFGAYRACQARSTFPRAASARGRALEELGYELNQARQRMKVTDGVGPEPPCAISPSRLTMTARWPITAA